MKKLLTNTLFISCFLYFIFLFIEAEPNPLIWGWISRTLFIAVWLFWNIATWQEIQNKEKEVKK
jgi:hypothetical protein